MIIDGFFELRNCFDRGTVVSYKNLDIMAFVRWCGNDKYVLHRWIGNDWNDLLKFGIDIEDTYNGKVVKIIGVDEI